MRFGEAEVARQRPGIADPDVRDLSGQPGELGQHTADVGMPLDGAVRHRATDQDLVGGHLDAGKAGQLLAVDQMIWLGQAHLHQQEQLRPAHIDHALLERAQQVEGVRD